MAARHTALDGVASKLASAVARLEAGICGHASAKEAKEDIRLVASAHAKKPEDHEKHETYDAHTAEYFG